MTEKSYLPYVGRVLFPRGPADLTSTTQCPACFTPLAGVVCRECGLDLAHPLAAELQAAGVESAAALDRRLELIGRIRFESAAASQPVAAPAAAPVSVAAAAPVATVAAPVAVAPPAPPSAPAPAPDAPPRRHLGVQVILLIVGVSLLSVGAIFFLVYAFITFGLVWRSIIILAVTVACFVGASLLRRRKLVATAEAIGALAVVFVYLDAFALRANDLFGTGSADGFTYWGIVLLVSAVGFAAWHRLSGLRVANVVAFTAVAPGLALLVAGLGEPLDDPLRSYLSLVALSVGALVHPLAVTAAAPAARPERIIPLSLGILGLLGAFVAALAVSPEVDWAPAVTLPILVLVAAAHVVVLARVQGPVAMAGIFGAIGGAVAAATLGIVGLRVNDFTFMVVAPPIAGAVVSLLLELVARRSTRPVLRPALIVAAVSSAIIAGVIALAPFVVALVPTLSTLGLSAPRWGYPFGYAITLPRESGYGVLALAIIVALTAGAWAIGRVIVARRAVFSWSVAAVLMLAAPLLGMLGLTVIAWLAIAAGAVVGLVTRRLPLVPVAVAGAAALVFGYSASWASRDTWWWASLAVIVILLAARLATANVIARAVLLGISVVVAFVAAGSIVEARGDVAHTVGILAVLLLAAAALVGRPLAPVDTRVLFWMSFATSLGASATSWILGAWDPAASESLPEHGTSVVHGGLLIAALVLWVLLPRTRSFGVERVAASIAIAPAVAWLVDSITRVADAPTPVTDLAPVTAALLVAAVSLAIALRRAAEPRPAERMAREVGVGLVAIPAIASSAGTLSDSAWLVLVLGGVTALLLAISNDGLVGSTSPRKHLGWVALTLATGGLWWRLADGGITDVEAYVLPVAGVLLIVAALGWRARSDAAPFVALGALLVAILPVAVAGTSDSVVRTIAVVAVSAVLLFAGSIARSPRSWLDVLAVAGAAGVLVGAFGRAIATAITRDSGDLGLDLWLAVGLVLIVGAAVAQARLDSESTAPGVVGVRGIVGQAFVGVALAAVLVFELAVIEPTTLGAARALAVIVVFGVVHVTAFLLDRVPFTRLIAWGAIAGAGVMAVAAIIRDVVDPLEWATLPIGAALLVTGAWHLSRTPAARSWPWLAPGILVILLPSLIATFVDQPIWRLVGLGVACIVAIVVGATRKLQAPLLLGAVIVLIHGLRTFAPAIRTVYELTEWWVWAVVGGAIVLFLGLTYEKRLRDLRTVTSKVSELR